MVDNGTHLLLLTGFPWTNAVHDRSLLMVKLCVTAGGMEADAHVWDGGATLHRCTESTAPESLLSIHREGRSKDSLRVLMVIGSGESCKES